jgi:hypothetical protein
MLLCTGVRLLHLRGGYTDGLADAGRAIVVAMSADFRANAFMELLLQASTWDCLWWMPRGVCRPWALWDASLLVNNSIIIDAISFNSWNL